MGTCVTAGDDCTAPKYYCNASGLRQWSGLKENEMTPSLEKEMYQFIKFEARRRGENDELAKKGGSTANPFSEKFLRGWPHDLWEERYAYGLEIKESPDRYFDPYRADMDEHYRAIREEFK